MARVIDLFCGIGGLTHGLQQSGLNVVAGIDIDDSCKFAYENNNNSLFIHSSISNIESTRIIEMFDNDVSILVGCAPCQPFSNHQKNKKNRKNHKDWNLLYDFLRLIRESTPTIISMENVPTLIKEDVFTDFIDGLNVLGYFVNYSIHDTQNFGMAQRRKRLVLLASRLGEISFAEDYEQSQTVGEVIGHLPPINAGETCLYDHLHTSCKLSEINLSRIKHSKPGGTWKDWPKDLLPKCYTKESGNSYTSVYGRINSNDLAPTLTTQFHSYGTGRFGHPTQNRALSIREGLLLQSFPENYNLVSDDKNIKISVLSRQIGNAVPPRLGLHIGRSIIQHLNNYNIN